MAKHLPPYHSPLSSLGKKVLLWIIVPFVLLATGVYVTGGFDTTHPPTEAELKSLQEAEVRAAELRGYAPTVIKANDLKARLATPTSVDDIQQMLRLLKRNELTGSALEDVKKMDASERAKYKQDILDGLSATEKAAYAKALQDEAAKKPILPVAAASVCDDNKLIPGMKARLAKDGSDSLLSNNLDAKVV
ncbi:MAG: hypothetical protein ACLPPF_21375 [Rhodomicrobium sp.]